MLVVFTAGIGVWPASYAIGSEVSSLRLRSKAQGIGWFVYGLGTMVFGVVMPYLYNPDAGNIGSFTAFVYFAFAGLGAVVSFFFVPEMKGRSTKEIDQMFDLRLPAERFKNWSGDEHDV
jgi:MFS family permease